MLEGNVLPNLKKEVLRLSPSLQTHSHGLL